MAANASVDVGGNGVCSGADAVRTSVCRSEGGGTGLRTSNAVTSVTKNLRLAYPGVECNIPLIP